MGCFGGSAVLESGSLPSVDSRFRLVEELIEAGESGRDNAAAPLTWGATTVGDAMVGGGCGIALSSSGPRKGGMWDVDRFAWWFGLAGSVARFASSAKGRTLLRGTAALATPTKTLVVGGPAR